MWFIVNVNKDSESIEVIENHSSFDKCWESFSIYLSNPQDKGNSVLRMCQSETQNEAIETIRTQLDEDNVAADLQKGTPDRIVRQWAKSYGKDMDKAASFTTDNYRGGKSPQEWILSETAIIEDTGFDPGDGKGKVIRNVVKGNSHATVEFSRMVTTKKGKERIYELYTLNNEAGKWRIDKIEAL